jgi:hypothetical protein
VAIGTAHRALTLLRTWGLVELSRGRRGIVLPANRGGLPVTQLATHKKEAATNFGAVSTESQPALLAHVASGSDGDAQGRHVLELELVSLGISFRRMITEADPTDFAALQQLMRDALRRAGTEPTRFGEFEMNVRIAGRTDPITTLVVSG